VRREGCVQPPELAPELHVALATRGALDFLPQVGLLPKLRILGVFAAPILFAASRARHKSSFHQLHVILERSEGSDVRD